MPRNEIQRSVLSELVQWIKNNLEKKLTMRALSLFSGYSEWHLFRLFRHYFNMSPMAYIRQQRMQLALDLLKLNRLFASVIFVLWRAMKISVPLTVPLKDTMRLRLASFAKFCVSPDRGSPSSALLRLGMEGGRGTQR
ncbi:AraC family transcriptional regulator [Klebsiella michiganensis]|uniref:AraC family transcriptional regulator n=1 Tax=Klebsiella michiganensis TaxID=1134687 RepID=A0A7H5AE98_9ENTR|nr:AraC family transcriptional regulator [Klebsiella michiganensis]